MKTMEILLWKSKKMSDRCSRKIAYLRFLLILGVVISHSTNYNTYPLRSFGAGGIVLEVIERTILFWELGGTSTFYLISGYLFFRNFTIDDLPKKYKSRIKSLFFPYCIWQLIGFAYWEFLYSLPQIGSLINIQMKTNGIRDFLLKFFLSRYNGPLWFVRDLMVIILISPVIYFLIHKKSIGGICIIILLTLGIRGGGSG